MKPKKNQKVFNAKVELRKAKLYKMKDAVKSKLTSMKNHETERKADKELSSAEYVLRLLFIILFSTFIVAFIAQGGDCLTYKKTDTQRIAPVSQPQQSLPESFPTEQPQPTSQPQPQPTSQPQPTEQQQSQPTQDAPVVINNNINVSGNAQVTVNTTVNVD